MPKTLYINGRAVKAVAVNGQNVKAIGDGVNELWEKAQPDYFYIENLADSANTVTLPKTGSKTEWVALEYSLDKETWNNYDLETGVSVPVGGKLYLRGDNNQLGDSVSGSATTHTFVSTGNIKAGGKAISLLSKDLSKTTIDYWFAFASLFQNNTKLINTETTLFDGFDLNNSYAFQNTFNGCTNLQDVCAFKDVTVGRQSCFLSTYRDCITITDAGGFLPNLTEIVGNQVFFYTFRGCTSLTTLPSFVNVAIGAGMSVYNGTFYGCTAVTTPAAMPQTAINVTGSHKFASMYYGDTNLQRSPKLSIATATDNMLESMFNGCSNIDYINIEFSAWDGASNFTTNWVNNVHSTGVFCKNSALTVTRGASNIPTNWSIADLDGKLYAPVITNNSGTITIAEAEGGASCEIYYTTDGSTPTTSSTLYTAPFAVASGTTVKAIAHYSGQSAAYVAHSDVAVLLGEPTMMFYGSSEGTGAQSICSGGRYHRWIADIKTPGVEGVTYYINYLNSATSGNYPSDPTTTVYDMTAAYSGQTGCVEGDSEAVVSINVCVADMAGDYLDIAVIGVADGNVSSVSYLEMQWVSPV